MVEFFAGTPGGAAGGIEVENSGTLLAGGPFTTFNFENSNIVATNAGGGVANITVPGGGGGVTPAYGVAYGANSTVLGADSAVVFDLGATPYPNAGFTTVPSPGGTAFVVATTGDYEFDFYVTGTHAAMGTTPLAFEIYVGGASVARTYQFVGALNPTLQQTVVGRGIIHLTAGASVTLHNRTNTVTDTVTVTNPAATGADAGSSNRMFSLTRVG